MRRIYIGKGIRFLLHERVFEITEDMNDKIRAEDKTHGGERIFLFDDLLRFLENGELRFERLGKNTEEKKKGFRQSKYADTSVLPENIRDELEFRMEAIRPLIGYNGKLEPALLERKDSLDAENRRSTSTASLRRWLNAWKDSGGDKNALVPNYRERGFHENRLQSEVDLLITQNIQNLYKNREKITVVTVRDEVIRKIDILNRDRYRKPEERLIFPSESTIRRRILECDPRELSEARDGKKRSFDKFVPVMLQQKPKYPLERVEMDHTLLDLFVVDDDTRQVWGRPNLTTVLDCATGHPLGFYVGFEPPGYTSVMLALKHAIGTKSYIREMYKTEHDWLAYGIPDVLIVDRGKEFLSKDLEDACDQLNIELVHCPPRKPWYKGQAERYFRTINQSLLHQQKGTSFSNVIQRGDYNSEKNAVISFSALMEMIHVWICDIYSQEYSKGVKGVPARLWEEGIKMIGRPALPSSKLDWEIALMKIETGSIQRTGIRHNNLHYQSNEFGELQRKLQVKPINQRLVTFKFDPTDISKIYVYDEFDDAYIIADVVEQEYAVGMNLYTHKAVTKLARKEMASVDRVSLANAKKRMAVLVKAEGKNTKIARRKNIARMKGIGSDQTVKSHNKPKVEKQIARIKQNRTTALNHVKQNYEDDWSVFREKRRF
jgi:putative transposase